MCDDWLLESLESLALFRECSNNDEDGWNLTDSTNCDCDEGGLPFLTGNEKMADAFDLGLEIGHGIDSKHTACSGMNKSEFVLFYEHPLRYDALEFSPTSKASPKYLQMAYT